MDVQAVQKFLNKHAFATHLTVKADGHYGSKTDSAIRAFQRIVLGMQFPDGIVRVGSLTLERLQRSSIDQVCRMYPWLANSCPVGLPSDNDYANAAQSLSCEVAAIKAVGYVESGGRGGYYPDGRAVILFERHIFHRDTHGRFDKDFPDISNGTPGGYGNTHLTEAGANTQYGKLERAYNLDSDAAMEAASWGAFQLLGDGYDLCGFDEVEDMVKAMTASVSNQLNAFVSFVKNKPGALPAIQKKDWLGFARAYNGKNQDGYDTKMARAYATYNK